MLWRRRCRLKDTGDDAREGPQRHSEADVEDPHAVHARLHAVRQQRLRQDVQSAHAQRQHGAQQVNREQRGLLQWRRPTGRTSANIVPTNSIFAVISMGKEELSFERAQETTRLHYST